MARISELHYSNAYASNSGVSEFLEVALRPSEDPADFVVGFYQADGSLGIEVALTDSRVTSSVDPDNGEQIFVLSADNLPIFLTDPDGGGSTNYEAYALTNTDSGVVQDFYDIGGGTQNITAASGAAAGAVSENIPTVVGPESTTTSIQFNQPNPDVVTYDPVGPGDTGLACFRSGTRVETAAGTRAVEELKVGEMVLTKDSGEAPIRWLAHRTVPGRGRFAPVRLAKGAFGATGALWLSPQHRVLVSGARVELLFAQSEVLVPAKALVDGETVCRVEQAEITYVHFAFDRHQLVQTHGLWSESYLFDGRVDRPWISDTEDELLALFPELVTGPTRSVRPVVSVKAGALLRAELGQTC